jgi:hypothetical protein
MTLLRELLGLGGRQPGHNNYLLDMGYNIFVDSIEYSQFEVSPVIMRHIIQI